MNGCATARDSEGRVLVMVTYTRLDDRLVCAFSGRLDTAFCLEIEEELLTQCEQALCPVVFDLDEVDYLSSMFLRLCLRVAKEVGRESLSITRVPAPLYKVFKVAGLDRLLEIEAP